jgi:hypothetical protein
MIQDYKFGYIKIKDKIYNHDIIMYRDKISSWWRKEGHNVVLEDIEGLIKEKPEIIVFGSGAYGAMRVDESLINYLQERKIIPIVELTERAVLTFNKLLKEKKKVACCLHLTC